VGLGFSDGVLWNGFLGNRTKEEESEYVEGEAEEK